MSEYLHFIGIGGVSMSTLALIARKNGNTVTGSDRQESKVTQRLRDAGIKVFCPQRAENIGRADRVVYTAAISPENPEYAEAVRRGLPLVRRSEYLGEIMKNYSVRIGVSGTHGKSSTTGMLSAIFTEAGADPTVACGADLSTQLGAYRDGGGEHFIYEACEYKDSFLDFYPSIAVILNIEMDHPDYFKDLSQMKTSYLRSTEHAGAVVINWDDGNARDVASGIGGAWIVKTGFEDPQGAYDYSARNITFSLGCASFDLMKENLLLGRVELSVPGLHHVHNALCAAACAHVCGLDSDAIIRGLCGFTGVKRRFEYLGTVCGARYYDDYAHHPTEIAATLKTARAILSGTDGRLFCVFQPHTYSRTAKLFEDFVRELSQTDRLFLMPIYAARETNTYGVSSDRIAGRVKGARAYEGTEEIARELKNELRPGDLLLTMGAGEAYKVGTLLLEESRP